MRASKPGCQYRSASEKASHVCWDLKRMGFLSDRPATKMEFTPAGSCIRPPTCCYCDVGGAPGADSGGVDGRRRCCGAASTATRLPMGLHVMFWCFVAMLLGTLQLSNGAATAVPNNTTTTYITLVVPREHVYSKEALLEWTLVTFDPAPSQVMGFYITLQREGSNSKTLIMVDRAFSSETVRNLEPDNDYRAFIKAVFNDTDLPFMNSAITRFSTPEQRYRGTNMGPTEFIILFLIFALWGLAMLRFFGTWNKKMNLRVTKDTIRTRDVSPTHRHLEAYRTYKKNRLQRQQLAGERSPRVGGGRSWQRSSTMKSFRARAQNFSRKTRLGSFRSSTSAPPSPQPERLSPECQPLRSEELLVVPHDLSTPTRNPPRTAVAAAAAAVVGVPVHVSYEASASGASVGGGSLDAAATGGDEAASGGFGCEQSGGSDSGGGGCSGGDDVAICVVSTPTVHFSCEPDDKSVI